jgi:hypothetical protein
LDDTTAKPLADRGAPRAAHARSAAHEPTPTWPILARIAEVAENDPTIAASDSTLSQASSRVSYRVDAPHAAASPIHTSPPARPLQRSGASEASTDATERQERALAIAPLPIRLTVQAWRLMQPYLGIIRFAAMLALMAIGGTSMTLMMGGFLRSADAPAGANTTTVDQTSNLQAEPAAIAPKLPLGATTPPNAEAASIAPTASGPTSAESKLLMAIESGEPTVAATPPLAEVPASTATANLPARPTQLDPAATPSNVDSEPWPQVRTAAPAIATLQGVVVETQTR